MPELIRPTTRLHAGWLECRDDFGRGVHQDGAGLRPADEVDSGPGFAAWVDKLTGEEDPAVVPAEGWVHCTYRWVVEDDRVLGSIALRHELNALLLDAGGHIGYSVRPSARRRGLASWALGEMLSEARRLGLDRVLVTCKVGNVASARTIERRGGVLEDVRDTELGTMKRYWIALSQGRDGSDRLGVDDDVVAVDAVVERSAARDQS
ncbi:GNAT family N-acetyltransferase [Actinoplanes sp. M2I2]|uniref:GNAT family N-acetyltransferase n=1 Tax=Actinoplanes sp. M2I2 TaxID=1734444 RepID=UPI002022654C|nr:GNAT family N-acetyltransferase [Actinoplanes sp. M2I2]